MPLNSRDFIKAIQQSIYSFLKTHPATHGLLFNASYERLIIGNCPTVGRFSFMLHLEHGTCTSYPSVSSDAPLFNHIDISRLPASHQQHLVRLLQTLTDAETHVHLWQEIQQEVRSMPGWWHFFSDIRPLTVLLHAVLTNFADERLNPTNMPWLRQRLRELKDLVIALITQMIDLNHSAEALMVESQDLEPTNQQKIGQVLAQIQQDKELLLEELDKLQHLNHELRTQLNQLTVENNDLAANNIELMSMNDTLQEELNTLYHKFSQIEQQTTCSLKKIQEKTQAVCTHSSSSLVTPAQFNAQHQRYSHNSHRLWPQAPRSKESAVVHSDSAEMQHVSP